jgi:hypothetical protein
VIVTINRMPRSCPAKPLAACFHIAPVPFDVAADGRPRLPRFVESELRDAIAEVGPWCLPVFGVARTGGWDHNDVTGGTTATAPSAAAAAELTVTCARTYAESRYGASSIRITSFMTASVNGDDASSDVDAASDHSAQRQVSNVIHVVLWPRSAASATFTEASAATPVQALWDYAMVHPLVVRTDPDLVGRLRDGTVSLEQAVHASYELCAFGGAHPSDAGREPTVSQLIDDAAHKIGLASKYGS